MLILFQLNMCQHFVLKEKGQVCHFPQTNLITVGFHSINIVLDIHINIYFLKLPVCYHIYKLGSIKLASKCAKMNAEQRLNLCIQRKVGLTGQKPDGEEMTMPRTIWDRIARLHYLQTQ